MDRLAAFARARARLVLAAAIVLVALAAPFALRAESGLSPRGLSVSSWESSRAGVALATRFPLAQPNFVVVLEARRGSARSGPVPALGAELARRLVREPGVVAVATPFAVRGERGLGSGGAGPRPVVDPRLVSADGRVALVVAELGGNGSAVVDATRRLESSLPSGSPGVQVAYGGVGPALLATAERSEAGLRLDELIALPVVGLLLVVMFGTLAAAATPLAVAIVSVVVSLAVLDGLSTVTTVSVYSANIVTGLGLGLGVDYALLLVSRYREELAAGREASRALSRTMRTAGRTVALSAATVAAATAALVVLPMPGLRSAAYAGVSTVVVAAVGALVVLPALLSVLGARLEWGRVPGVGAGSRRAATLPPTEGAFYRRARWTFRRPWAVLGAVAVLLAVLGAPALHVRIGAKSLDLLSPGDSARVASETIARSFPALALPVTVVLSNPGGRGPVALDAMADGSAASPDGAAASPDGAAASPDGAAASPDGTAASPADTDATTVSRDETSLAGYAARLSRLRGVEEVTSAAGVFARGAAVAPAPPGMGDANGSWVGVVAPFAAGTQTAADLAVAVRAVPAPSGALVGGPGGETVDTSASLRRWLPLSWALGALACLVVMFLLAGSVLVPVKAVVLNGLSLVTSLGVVTWVFQDGHGAGLLGFTTPGTLDLTVPTLVFGIALGLSMDYEVFLLARIKEEHDLGADDDEAVAVGLQRTGRIVTLAAATMALTFLTFVVNGVSAVQAIGLGLATAVVVDALVIRTFALPALMHLAGRANWWAPRKLRRFHLLAGVWEAEPVAVLEVGRPVSQAALGALVRPESDDAER